MTITIPIENVTWPVFRVLVRNGWGGTSTSAADWTVLPMLRRGEGKNGFRLLDLERCTLPMFGRAKFALRYGDFQDAFTLMSAESVERQKAGTAWNPRIDSMAIPSYAGYEVRIQVAPKPDDDATAPTFKTCWLGYVDYEEDIGWPGSLIPAGERTYHCVESIARTSRWQMNRHGLRVSGTEFADAVGHPGYNVGHGRDGILAGNNEGSQYALSDGVGVNYHTYPGAGSTWSDADALDHALAATRPVNEPHFLIGGTTTLLSGATPWEITEGTTVLDFLSRVLKRERGKGVAFVDWDHDAEDANGALAITLTVNPQFWATQIYINPITGGNESIIGAAAATPTPTAIDVDLTGDHRVDVSSFQLGSPNQWRYDYLETLGERIEVLATLAYIDGNRLSLERRWSGDEELVFDALTTKDARKDGRYDPVYQSHSLPRSWAGQAGDGNNGGNARIDYRCGDDGSIVVPSSDPDVDRPDTSPSLVEILSDIPIFMGYTYTGATPARHDGGAEIGNPPRHEPIILYRKDDNAYITTEQSDRPQTLTVWNNTVKVYSGADQAEGTRYVSDTSVTSPSLEAAFETDDLALTVALRLPHRARMASFRPGISEADAKRRLSIEHPGMHIWLASPGAVWDLNTSSGSVSAGFAPRRYACNPSPHTAYGKLRDDRAALARLHALSYAWYLNERRTASWTLRDCGFLPSFITGTGDDAETVAYPRLGEVVHEMKANGETHTIDTPIVRIYYDNENGATTWETGWSGLDFE